MRLFVSASTHPSSTRRHGKTRGCGPSSSITASSRSSVKGALDTDCHIGAKTTSADRARFDPAQSPANYRVGEHPGRGVSGTDIGILSRASAGHRGDARRARQGSDTVQASKHTGSHSPRLLSAPPGPEQDCQDNRPNDAPPDPRDVWVGRLPFENVFVNCHCLLPTVPDILSGKIVSLDPGERTGTHCACLHVCQHRYTPAAQRRYVLRATPATRIGVAGRPTIACAGDTMP